MELISVFSSNNNYTLMNGLQLDMAPDIGPLDSKIVIIDKNDQSEGIIQFTSTSIIGLWLIHSSNNFILNWIRIE